MGILYNGDLYMNEKSYNRSLAIAYAQKWALSRNPRYYNFDVVGGDCTSFISQCLFAGSNVMNYNYENGWFYNNGYDKSPSWSGVEFLYKFLINNRTYGPRGILAQQKDLIPGDIAQISFSGTKFEHSLFILDIKNPNDLSTFLIAAHTNDVLGKKISQYSFKKIRFVHITNVGFE